MDECGREMTFKEEYEILKLEANKLFESEIDGCEAPKVNSIVRRALRCINKLAKENELTKECSELEEQTQRMIELAKENICQLLYIGIHNTDEHIDKHFGGEKELMDLIQRYSILLGDLIRLNKIESEVNL